MSIFNREKSRLAIPNWQGYARDRLQQALEVYFGSSIVIENFVSETIRRTTTDETEERSLQITAVVYCQTAFPTNHGRMETVELYIPLRRWRHIRNWHVNATAFITLGDQHKERFERRMYEAIFTDEDGSVVPLVSIEEQIRAGCGSMADLRRRSGHHLGDRVLHPRN